MAELKPEFGYVLAVATASTVVHNMYMGVKVGMARKKYDIKYPDLYATKDNCPNEEYRKKFNCVQRAHQNSLENYPAYLGLLTLAGLKFPITAAAFGASYLVGRIGYFEGYSSGNPDKRINPLTTLNYVGLLGLMGTCIAAAVKLLTSK